MTPADAAGMVGVAAMLVAYAAAQLKRLDPARAPSLLLNLGGSSLVMLSLVWKFNLAAFLMEASWALVAGAGLFRLLLKGSRGRTP
ncbi:MAG: hypothetical protein JOZ27_08200 [Caulobacteraceae bacterium]|nr:hypothetical protein [Caulobacteraceae bacterium]